MNGFQVAHELCPELVFRNMTLDQRPHFAEQHRTCMPTHDHALQPTTSAEVSLHSLILPALQSESSASARGGALGAFLGLSVSARGGALGAFGD